MSVPLLGLGTGEGGMGLADDAAAALYHAAIDEGVCYIDTAPGYGGAHRQLARVLRERRREVVLATKVPASNGKRFIEGMETNLRDLGVDSVDIAYIHSVGEQDPDEVLSEEGSLAALFECKRRGMARFVGFTAHSRPSVAARILRAADGIDVVMLAMNFVERHVYGFEDTVLPIAAGLGVGVAAMKVYGGTVDMKYDRPYPSALAARGGHDLRSAFRYAAGLPGVSLAVVGAYSPEELRRNADWARTFAPLTPAEEERLQEEGKRAAAAWGERYGPKA